MHLKVLTPVQTLVDEPAVRRSLEANNGGAVDASRLAVALARAKAEDVSAAHPGAVVVGADDALRDASYDGGLALGVDRLAPHQLADVLVELLDEVVVRARRACGRMGQ